MTPGDAYWLRAEAQGYLQLNKFCRIENRFYICTLEILRRRAISSVGSEHPDEKSGGSVVHSQIFRAISSVGSEHLPYKQRVGGSTPSSPTKTFL